MQELDKTKAKVRAFSSSLGCGHNQSVEYLNIDGLNIVFSSDIRGYEAGDIYDMSDFLKEELAYVTEINDIDRALDMQCV